MSNIVIDRFGGIAPLVDEYKLPPYGAQAASNCNLAGGVLRGWRKPAPVSPSVSTAPGTKTIYYDPDGALWFQWTSDVDVVRGPVADPTARNRYYYAGDGPPKKTDSAMASGSPPYPSAWLYLAVPAPAVPPTVSITTHAGTGTAQDVVYVVTYVSEFSGIEEESAPSAPVTLSGWQDGTTADTVTLTWGTTPPTTGYNITKRRVYRSHGADYFFVGEYPVSTYPTSATESVTQAALGEAISTIDFDVPPNDLRCLSLTPNGALVGLSGNELCFSEPYQPHAWPAKYRIPIADYPVGLVVVGQSIYIGTRGRPYVVTGVHPESMSVEFASQIVPCLSKRALVTDGIGALFPTISGLAYVQGVDVQYPLIGAMSNEEWAYYNPNTMLGAFYDNRYLLWYTATDSTKGALLIDRNTPDAPITALTDFTEAAHVRYDTGRLHMVQSDNIVEFDADQVSNTPYSWRSKVFTNAHPTNFSYLRVMADASVSELELQRAAAIAANAALWASGNIGGDVNGDEYNTFEVNGSALQSIPSIDAGYVAVDVFADGALVHSASVDTDDAMTMPGGFLATDWEVRITGNKPVRRVSLSNTLEEVA